ncbi:MAG: cation diffusion facilitator family transporter [Candidatus Atribacteria bacterium]|jgi:cation diffusion facilitator family transporter|nr:cation diffusion facilitator family transporter [Candidatus Atribacteria bacterium]
MKINSSKPITQKYKTYIGYLEGTISVVINTILFGLKYWVGIQTFSIAIIADAWHTLSDTLTSLVVIVGFKMSSKPADKKHPFGHGRAEVISSIIIATLLAVVGFSFLLASIQKYRNQESASFNKLAIIMFIISVIAKEGLAQYSFRLGKNINSQSLMADGWHHRSDAIASMMILVGMFVDFWWIDSIMGILVSLIIFYTTYKILKESISILIGEEPSETFKADIIKIITRSIPHDVSLHHLHSHIYGDSKELTFHIKLSADMKLEEAHKIAEKLEKEIKNEMDIDTTIHMEPIIPIKR